MPDPGASGGGRGGGRLQLNREPVALTGLAARRAKELLVTRVLLSLSHTHEAAVAIAVLSTD